jgi:hypothetical protein
LLIAFHVRQRETRVAPFMSFVPFMLFLFRLLESLTRIGTEGEREGHTP